MNEIVFERQDVDNTLQITQKIIDECPSRLTGSESCCKASQLIEDHLKEHCDEVKREEFLDHPLAFMGFMKFLAISYTISTILLFIGGIGVYIATIGYTLGIFLGISQFVMYWEIFDPFYKKSKGYNVIGKINPSKEVKQQIIISGHHDSAYVFNFLVNYQKLYAARIFSGLIPIFAAVLFSWIWSIFRIINGTDPSYAPYMRYITLGCLLFVFPLFFFITNKGTPGAGDNLIAVAVLIKIAEKYGKKSPKTAPFLKHTRLIFASFDAEEAGLRGARAYARKHKKEFKDIPTYNLNIDSLYNVKDIQFITADINSTVPLSEKMASECIEISESLGYPSKPYKMTFGGGGTDAAELAKMGVVATTLIAMPSEVVRDGLVYHTLEDTVDKIEPEVVEASLKIVNAYILQKDQEVQ